jgi:hypothetical protein
VFFDVGFRFMNPKAKHSKLISTAEVGINKQRGETERRMIICLRAGFSGIHNLLAICSRRARQTNIGNFLLLMFPRPARFLINVKLFSPDREGAKAGKNLHPEVLCSRKYFS